MHAYHYYVFASQANSWLEGWPQGCQNIATLCGRTIFYPTNEDDYSSGASDCSISAKGEYFLCYQPVKFETELRRD